RAEATAPGQDHHPTASGSGRRRGGGAGARGAPRLRPRDVGLVGGGGERSARRWSRWWRGVGRVAWQRRGFGDGAADGCCPGRAASEGRADGTEAPANEA